MLAAIAARCPSLLRYALWCYGSPTPLKANGYSIRPEWVLNRGLLCGLLFFAVTLHAALRDVLEALPWAAFYLDDGYLCGPADLLGRALTHLEARASAIDLKFHRAKCRLWGSYSSTFQHPGLQDVL
eukprot:RCo013120